MTVGIVTLSFNQAKYVQQAISSVSLSHPHLLKYVLVDAGSTDGSRDLVAASQNRFAKVIFEPDEGPADGLNKGFAALKDVDICGYLNADDRLVPGALDYVVDYFTSHPNVDILLGSILIIDSKGKARIRGRRADRVTLSRFAEKRCVIWQQATFFRRSALDRTSGFNKQNRNSWDSELVVDMLLAGATVASTHRVLGEFRIHGESITGSTSARHAAEYHRRQALVEQKIWAAGYRKHPPRLAAGLRAFYRISPSRHAWNFFIGLKARFTGVTKKSTENQQLFLSA
jgi:glycosyltransferase involved in cell wall biosynthesis